MLEGAFKKLILAALAFAARIHSLTAGFTMTGMPKDGSKPAAKLGSAEAAARVSPSLVPRALLFGDAEALTAKANREAEASFIILNLNSMLKIKSQRNFS